MPVQRLVLVALLLVVVLGVASVAGRPPADDGGGTAATQAPPPAARTGRVVEADLATSSRVRARVGDVVVLTFEAGDGRVAVPELGVDEGVLAGVPTTLRFTAVAEGRFAVRVGDPPRRRIAAVVVTPAESREPPEAPRAPEMAPDRPITARVAAPAAAAG